MSRLNINNLTNENEDGSPKISGISTFSSTHYFVPPSGTTAERPSHADPGMIRFNTDSGHLEYYNGVEWTSVIVNNNELGISNNAAGTSGGLGVRGVFSGIGGYPTISNVMNYVNVETTGNAIDFGDLTLPTRYGNAIGSRTRGIVYEAITPSSSYDTDIQYFTFASTGNTTDFGGDLVNTNYDVTGASNSTRGLFNYGTQGPGFTFVAKIDYVTIQSTGTNAQSFGNLSTTRNQATSFSSSVRGVFAGGMDPGIANTIDYVTISTLGNAQDFGDLPTTRRNPLSCSNSTRGVIGGGNNPTYRNEIEFVTIATTGNAQDFGDLTVARGMGGGASSATRGVFGGGSDSPSNYDTIDYITFSSTGDAKDFGDLSRGASRVYGACSNGHGGL